MNRRAFTLMELLVVVAIMIVLFAIAVPGTRALLNSGRSEQAVKFIQTSVASVRSATGIRPPITQGDYHGTALIFTPSGELRLTQHDPNAKQGTVKISAPNTTAVRLRAGYADMADREYMHIPTGVGVVGIIRTAAGGGATVLIPPPFAVRFNPLGQLIPSTPDIDPSAAPAPDPYGTVSYDGDYDGSHEEISRWSTPVGPWEPEKYDPDGSAYDDTLAYDSPAQRYKLPWEELDAVIGVVVYDKTEFAEAGNDLSKDGPGMWLNQGAADWILVNGEAIFFNRYSGASVH